MKNVNVVIVISIILSLFSVFISGLSTIYQLGYLHGLEAASQQFETIYSDS